MVRLYRFEQDGSHHQTGQHSVVRIIGRGMGRSVERLNEAVTIDASDWLRAILKAHMSDIERPGEKE